MTYRLCETEEDGRREWKIAMSTRTNKRRIYAMFDSRFHGRSLLRSAEEQAWLDVAPVGREFGSPDYERLQILDLTLRAR